MGTPSGGVTDLGVRGARRTNNPLVVVVEVHHQHTPTRMWWWRFAGEVEWGEGSNSQPQDTVSAGLTGIISA